MIQIKIGQARALALANGMTHAEIAWEFRPEHQGEVIVVFPEGTKITRRGDVFMLHGYTDTDVPRTMARMATLPTYRAPRKRK